MSYINDALRKAQREKDSRYIDFGGILRRASEEPIGSRGRWVLFFLFFLVVLLTVVIFLVVTLPNGGRQALTVTERGAETDKPKTAEPSVSAVQAEAGKNHREDAPQTVTEKPVSAPERKAAEPSPKAPQAGPETEALYESALDLQKVGRNGEAAALYERILLQEPRHAKSLNNLGVIVMAQRQRGRAAELFGRAIAIEGDYVDPYYNLACLYAQAGDHIQSLRYLKDALAISGEVRKWASADADLKTLRSLPEYRKLMEEKR